ncbi:MAG TPA: RidA family protein [Thermomicrobiaceae bacterium]|nr:RidA family protein [Thermomicrobiaceae bacterium]
MPKQIIATNDAPAAIGPYSQATKLGNIVFTAGQIALDPSTGKLVEGGIEEQATQVMNNLKAILAAAGSSLDKVLKTTCFLANIDDYPTFNQIYGTYFTSNPPARSAFQVAKLPAGAIVEVECIAECD